MPENNIIPFQPAQRRALADIIIEAQNLTVSRSGRTLIDKLSFSVPHTGITALLGPNGAGKSLILRLISGLMIADSGILRIAPDAADALSVVFQTPVVLKRTVRANLDHALKIYGVPKRERVGRIAELLVVGDLTHLAETQARALSGGEKQRLAMTRAIAARPKLLLLDEPTASLDPHATASIEQLTRRAANEGAKVILVTHDWAQAQRVCDDVLFVHRGYVTEHSPAKDFFERPSSEEGRAYLDGRILI